MKGKFGKIGIISLALVIALAGLGAAFAHWTETLTTEANVSTGCLQLKLTPDPIPCTDSEVALGLEDVGKICCTKTDGGPEYDFTEFTIEIENAYPGYWGRCTFNIENTGTIPAKICVPGTYAPLLPEWATVDIDKVLNLGVTPIIMNPGDYYLDRYIEVTINEEGTGLNGVVVECEENYSFSFTITIMAIQWNAPCP